MRHRQPHRRASATITALVSLGLVGVTIAVLMTRFGMESHRTDRENQRAQDDQIVIARSLGRVELPTELLNDSRRD